VDRYREPLLPLSFIITALHDPLTASRRTHQINRRPSVRIPDGDAGIIVITKSCDHCPGEDMPGKNP
jgi:hypothetical protein